MMRWLLVVALLASVAVGGDAANLVTSTLTYADPACYTVQGHMEHHTCDVCGLRWETWHSNDNHWYLNTIDVQGGFVSVGMDPIGYEPSGTDYGVTLCEECYAKHGEGLFKYLKGCRDTYVAALREKETERRAEVAAKVKADKLKDIDQRLAVLMDEAKTLREHKKKIETSKQDKTDGERSFP